MGSATCPTETHISSGAGSPTMSHWHTFGGARSAQDQCGYHAQGCPHPGKVSPGCPQKVTATRPPRLSRQLCVPHGDSSLGGHEVTSPPRRAGKRGCRAPPERFQTLPRARSPPGPCPVPHPKPGVPGAGSAPRCPRFPPGRDVSRCPPVPSPPPEAAHPGPRRRRPRRPRFSPARGGGRTSGGGPGAGAGTGAGRGERSRPTPRYK